MSRAPSTFPSSAPTPAPSSPPASESYLSELDDTAPSLIETSADFAWDARHVDPTALNIVSWKLDVNARAADGVDKRGFNAISTVLNHPTKRANPLRPSRKPLPPLSQPPPVLPKPPPPSHYDAYLKSITPLYEGFVPAQASSSTSATSISFDIRSPGPSKPDLPPLDSVPDSFFESNFDLANPTTWAELVDEDGMRQDSLLTYLDTLERHLVHEITLRSTSFFSALSNLQDLHSESASCLSRISDLQGSLKEVGMKQAERGLEVIAAQENLRVLRVTETGLQTVGQLETFIRVTRSLVEAGDWAGGLVCLGDVVRWWEKYGLHDDQEVIVNGDAEPPPTPSTSTLPLGTLPALSQLPFALSDLTASIASQLDAALTSLLLSVLARADLAKESYRPGFRESVEPMLTGLVRCAKTDGIEEVWRDIVTTSVREASRQHLPVGHTEDDGEDDGRPPEARGANLAQSLQAMDHSRFLLISTQMYGSMLSRLHLAQQIGTELAETMQGMESLTPLNIVSFVPESSLPSSAKANVIPTIDLADVLSSACELANARASKILAVRSEQHAALSLTEFVEVFKENWEFVVATETLAKRMIVSLRGVTASQARAFLVSYHAIRLTKSARLVEEEQWTQIDISRSIQHTVNLLIDSAVADPPECAIPPPPSPHTNGDAEEPAKVLKVEEKTFYLVKATAESLGLLRDYLSIVINLELVVTDVMSRIIEFLKSFNSRTCQVVLGAGAMRSAGLKNITAKHLALASQSLSVIVSLIPYIREFIRRHLNLKQAVMLTEFDKLKRDYQEHQNEIHAKLVAIMSDRLAVHCASLREIDWEADTDKDGPRSYAEMLVKETATLHKVLSKYLAQQTVEAVLSEVLAAIVHRLSEEYTKIELKTDDAKKRMTQDVAFISSRLSTLSESGKNVASLETLVKDKPTPRRPMGQTMAGLLRKASAATSPKTTEQGPKEEAKRPNGDVPLDEDEDGVGMVEEPSPIERAQAGAARTVQSHATEEATADGHGNLAVSNRNTESVGNAPNSLDENSVSVPTMGSPLKDDPIPPQPDPVAPNDELLLPASPIADPPAPPAKNGGADEGKDTPLPVIPTGAVEDTPLPAIPEKDDA